MHLHLMWGLFPPLKICFKSHGLGTVTRPLLFGSQNPSAEQISWSVVQTSPTPKEGHGAGALSWDSARAPLSHGPHPTAVAQELRDPLGPCRPVHMPEVPTPPNGVLHGGDQRWKGGRRGMRNGSAKHFHGWPGQAAGQSSPREGLDFLGIQKEKREK